MITNTLQAGRQQIVGLFDSARLAESLSECCKIPLLSITLHRFPDGEWRVQLQQAPAERVIIVCSLDHPDHKTLPLYLLASTLREQGVKEITLIAPYLAYMRQDIAFHPGESVSARHYARLLSSVMDRLVTVDPHLHRIHQLSEVYSVPAQALHATIVLGQWLVQHCPGAFLIGPDAESAQWVSQVAEVAGSEFVVLEKQRSGDRQVSIQVPALSLSHATPVVLVDDMISTGRTLVEAARQIHAQGYRNITALCVHALYDDRAAQEMQAAGINRVVSCNTVLHASNGVDISELLLGSEFLSQ